ncbi:Antitermination protein Q homolog from lambdoid prophage Qin [Xenorhabdus poinarii G6]|uniref:Antitermination protein Q homolog from lambdoid prophage Qin n=1 Tax=Xenorhabdus poinarii G6 TaxID=1354304 RepID=A0A068QY50_9GAMM|nr:antitermination protein [Xenorhabdus poinarii]CDG19977.1 Antitermination protein Q homolog from lambdoid prophage Qin [Xenorhabdus poinarii G6]
MNLESALKYHFAKSPSLTDAPKSTSSETLTGTDVMAAFGMCQSKVSFGYSAFAGKMGLSRNDREKSIKLLTQYGMRRCDKVAALRKLSPKIKVKVVQILAKFAFMDYARSAASVTECEKCRGVGIIYSKKEVIKHPGITRADGVVIIEPWIEVDQVGELCQKCNGKGSISCACKDCKGRGTTVDQEETERQGVPVRKACERCSGRGYERIPASKAFKTCKAISDITIDQWKRGVKAFYEDLIQECERGEIKADNMLKKVTSNFNDI